MWALVYKLSRPVSNRLKPILRKALTPLALSAFSQDADKLRPMGLLFSPQAIDNPRAVQILYSSGAHLIRFCRSRYTRFFMLGITLSV